MKDMLMPELIDDSQIEGTEKIECNNKRLLLIEDDESFAAVLARRLTRHHFQVDIAHNTNVGLTIAKESMPNFVLLDMKVGHENGIHILPSLRSLLPDSRIILLTGYASIATAVDAIKAGADDYLSKPIDGLSLLAALHSENQSSQMPSTKPATKLSNQDQDDVFNLERSMSPARIEWEHIQQVLKIHQGNISETARQLGMHRRTLQRKLAKKPQAN